jgi:hypothetical protein
MYPFALRWPLPFISLLSILASPSASGQSGVDDLGVFLVVAASADGSSAVGADDFDSRLAGASRWTDSGGLTILRSSITDGQVSVQGYSADGQYAVGTEDDDWGDSSIECDPRQDGNGWTSEGRIFSWLWSGSGGTRRLEPPDDFCYILSDVAVTGKAVGVRRDTVGDVNDVSGKRAVVWDGSSFADLVPGSSDPSEAVRISADGSTIVGWAEPFGTVRFDEGGPVALSTTPFNVTDISDDGSVIVGRSNTLKIVRWENGRIDTLSADSGFLQTTVLVSGDGRTIVAGWYGPFGPHNGPHARVFFDDGTDESLWQLAQDRGLDVGSRFFSQPRAVSGDGSIIFGLDPGSGFRVSLGGTIEIATPTADTLVVAGEDFEIRWKSSRVDTLDIFYGSTSIETNIAASDSSYVWSVPADSLDRHAQIIVSSSTDPFAVADTVTVRIKGYVLTRVDKDEEYEAFDPSLHGWSFANTASKLAPQTYADTLQFGYLDLFASRDPFTGVVYDVDEFDPLGIVNVRQFEDYPSFVRAFGESRFYWGPPILRIYRDSGLTFWKKRSSKKWGGSCSGMSISALMAFADSVRFGQTFPDIGVVGSLNNAVAATASTVPDLVRDVINKLFSYWNGQLADVWWDLNSKNDPRSTLAYLKSVLLDPDESNQYIGYLYISNGKGSSLPTRAHAVAPIALRRTSKVPSRWDLSIYDPNRPYTVQTIKIDSTANTWRYGSSYDGSGRFFMMDTHRNYFPQAVWPSTAGKRSEDLQPAGKTLGPIRLYATDWASVQIDGAGGSIGFTDSTVVGELPNAEAVIEPTGYPSSPAWYDLPDDIYELTQTDVDGDTAYVSFDQGDVTYTALRTDASRSQTDRFAVGDGLGIGNGDAETKMFQLSVLRPLSDEERSFRIRGLALAQNDSAGMEIDVGDLLRFEGKGDDRSYGVRIRRASLDTVMVFDHDGIPMTGNAVHQLAPNWDALGDSLTIRIDNDGDGVFEDSLLLANTATAIEGGPVQGGASLPEEFRLHSNYPNPFNPTTTISYALPQAADVTLTVYDVLGRQIRQLASGTKSTGTYEVTFDATGLPSGVYFYRLQAGDYVETKRMVIVR